MTVGEAVVNLVVSKEVQELHKKLGKFVFRRMAR